mmetsp:Transcript_9740/g.22379  ORF Transcript_9740/g.22379 Transcript_9740/m.22379 type:complete len:80 (+) Transcript_9740:195-434(+)
MTKHAPHTNVMFGRKLKNNAEISDEHSILSELENTLSTLSAYFTTTATMRPPTAWTVITATTTELYPTKKPFLVTSIES